MRNEYPRPNFVRENWMSLNGEWDFAFDDSNVGIVEEYYKNFPEDGMKINVPFAYQSELSGINLIEKHDVIWYRKNINRGEMNCLNFQAVDYSCSVYINGLKMIDHEGGSTPFSIDIPSNFPEEIEVVVRCYDPLEDESIPRGKQFWEEESRGIWYTPTSGIWQSVWLEKIDNSHVSHVRFDSDVDNGVQNAKIFTKNAIGKTISYSVSFGGELVDYTTKKVTTDVEYFATEVYRNKIFTCTYHDSNARSVCWSPENPVLFDVVIELLDDGEVVDKIETYFGFRKVETKNGMVYLNHRPYYQKLVLDQGYWPEGLLTAPKDEDFKNDILLGKEMGFNGCRKHQKVEDPRFLYWADKLGYLVWGEVEAPAIYNENAVEAMQKLWFEIIKRDYNHPCIVSWVPLNESWGVPNIAFDKKQQAHSLSLYHQIKSIDNTRMVVNNDGWEITLSDICAIHNYNHGNIGETAENEYYANSLKTKDSILHSFASRRPIYADGFENKGEPILLTEFGGIAYDVKTPNGWGYTSVKSADELVTEYGRILNDIYSSEIIYGYCYTQLTDVEQEVNGLLTYDRKPKCDLALIKKINDSNRVYMKPRIS